MPGLANPGSAPGQLLAVLFGLGLGGGFLSGLVGLGGAVFMVPLLLWVPPLLSVGALGIKEVTAISMVEVVFAALSGLIAHWRHHHLVSPRLVAYMGAGIVPAAFGGAVYSKYASESVLLAVFATMALFAALMMLIPHAEPEEPFPPEEVTFSRAGAFLTSALAGALGGMVGAGGGILLIPVMIHLLRVPTRLALGTNLGVVFLAAIFGVLGKQATGQIDWLLAAALVAGAVPGAQLGELAGWRIGTRLLRLMTGLVIATAASRMWYQVLTGR